MTPEELKAEEKRLFKEYKEKIDSLKKVQKEQEAVGQVFTKGLLPIYVFFILSLGPSNGNDICNKIGARTKGMWIPSTGGIYPLLKKLEKDGYIEGQWNDDKKKFQKLYILTPLGKEEFAHRKELLKPKIEEGLEVFKLVYKDIY